MRQLAPAALGAGRNRDARRRHCISAPSCRATSQPPPHLASPPVAQVDFSLDIFGYDASSFGAQQRADLCAGLVAAAGAVAPAALACVVGDVYSRHVPFLAAVASGYVQWQFSARPTAAELAAAEAQRDALALKLSADPTALFAAAGFASVKPNCACDGDAPVAAYSGVPLAFAAVTGVPLAQCDARRTYASAADEARQVGVDDGSGDAALTGKLCTADPAALAGSVAGVPGVASCRVYGSSVAASADPATAAVATMSVTGAAVVAAGSGYDGAVAVTATLSPGGAALEPTLSVAALKIPTDVSSPNLPLQSLTTGYVLTPPTATFNTPPGGVAAKATVLCGIGGTKDIDVPTIALDEHGSGYAVGDVLVVVGGGCVGAQVVVAAVSTDGSAGVEAWGAVGAARRGTSCTTWGFFDTACVKCADPAASGAKVAVSLRVVGYALVSGGSGYTALTPPVLRLTKSGSGTLPDHVPTYGTPLAAAFGGITTSVTGYAGTAAGPFAAVPTVAVAGSGGSGAAAAALMGVESLAVVKGGGGYTAEPTVTIAATSRGTGSGAVFTANLANGAVASFTKVQAGSGYSTIPSVAVDLPPASENGLLCSPTPIAGLADAASTPATVSSDPASTCKPLGINTIAKRPCSTPALKAGGVPGVVGVGDCSVVSAFRPTAGSATTRCAVMKQDPALSSAALSPPPPPPTKASPPPPPKASGSPSPKSPSSPSPKASSSPSAKASPAPGGPSAPSPKGVSPNAPGFSAPKSPAPKAPAGGGCTYGGNYRIQAVGREAECGVEFPSYYGGRPGGNQTLCATQSLELRTARQLPKPDRATFLLASTGEIKTVRRGCAAGEASWAPEGVKLRLRTAGEPKWKIEATGGDCNLVAIKSTAAGAALPYVSSPSPSGRRGCKERQLFMTDKVYTTGRQLFRLSKVE